METLRKIFFKHMYRASFIILHYDQQMHNYLTKYHTSTCFDTVVVIFREPVINA